MSAPSSSSENSSSIWSVINVIIGSVIGGAVFLWVLAFIGVGVKSLLPKAKVEKAAVAAAAPAAPAAPGAAAPAAPGAATAAATAAAAPAAPAVNLPVLEVTIKPEGPSGMAYDTKTISAKVGQKIKLTLSNIHPLPLPHNIVIGKLGTKDKMTAIATAGMTLPDKGFVPDSPDILAHTGLVQPTKSETVEFVVPAAGEYPFFCTFPGHFMLMNGVITVQ